MQGHANFRAVIKNYLEQRAQEDKLFAKSYRSKSKSIDECCSYIIREAQKRAKDGQTVMSDEEVFGLAVHYYDEAEIKNVKKVSCSSIISPYEADEPLIMK